VCERCCQQFLLAVDVAALVMSLLAFIVCEWVMLIAAWFDINASSASIWVGAGFFIGACCAPTLWRRDDFSKLTLLFIVNGTIIYIIECVCRLGRSATGSVAGTPVAGERGVVVGPVGSVIRSSLIGVHDEADGGAFRGRILLQD
jgi:hypothetical protein